MGGAGGQLLQVVGDQDGGQFGVVPAQGVQALQQLLTGGQIQTGGRFVEQQQPGRGISARAISTRPRWPCDRVGQRASSFPPMPRVVSSRSARSRWSGVGR
ncbi:hypothetical protein SVIO_079880 [Streptomyces violaceusniger]|uniref:Uncharacterized protein n=1 Tax=Streptomyces violaceusniger TaxID=68280 RepID=A0A4D4L8E2_STRVO|nr:hypothetical protein SVIO_079880 [Streptomyces violaceusniger]